jgi:hypothetical protein
MSGAREELAAIHTFPQLVRYLREELDWPIRTDDFEDSVFDYSAEDLGIDAHNAAKIEEIKRLRPLSVNQPWGVFFVKFEPKRLPVVALRRILSGVALRKRASANSPDHAAWAISDLLFISNYGEGDTRQIAFAHFAEDPEKQSLPTLQVLGWDNLDTPLHLDDVAESLTRNLVWPDDEANVAAWRSRWGSAFTLGHREVINTSREMAIRLAQLARATRDRIVSALAIETERGPLTQLMKAVQVSLVHDLDARGFADMYAQTIAYGLLSARIADPQSETAGDLVGHMRTNPMLRDLLQTFLHVGGRGARVGGPGIDFDELGVAEVVDLLNNRNIEAVLRDFGDRNPEDDPVIPFYELFLKEYDERQRMQRGVFYTPRPIVSYIVRSVDGLLRTQFGLEDGLADTSTWGEMATRREGLRIPEGVSREQPFVQILDPATGTGTFLVEVIDLIYKTVVTKWKALGHGEKERESLWNDYVPKHVLPRLHGFELLMAPYAIAHLKIGLKLYETGYRFESEVRARIFLTNSLEPAEDFSDRFLFAVPALAHEAQEVNEVKRKQRFTVVLGNPPYSGISSNMTEDAQRLVDAYKFVDGVALNERKIWLQDDYVKFIRMAQVTIERAHVGILGFITNHGYLDNPTFRGMRQSLIRTFPRMYVLDLHGNALKKERAPDGTEDKNVFEIRQGVAIFVGACDAVDSQVLRTDLWGSTDTKYTWLGSNSVETTHWGHLRPATPFYFFRSEVDDLGAYPEWPKLSELMPTYSSGVITARDELVLDYAPEPILERIELLRDTSVSDDALRQRLFEGKSSPKYPAGDSRGWKLPEARRKLRRDDHWRDRVALCLYRPFDERSVYLTEWMVDWSRPELRRHLAIGKNPLLVFPRNTGAGRPWDHVFVSYDPILGRFFPDSACITYMAPSLVLTDGMFDRGAAIAENSRDSVSEGLDDESEVRQRAMSKLGYIYAILHSPTYRRRYQSQLRADFPRIPPIANRDLMDSMARLGCELMSLHLMESPKLGSVGNLYVGAKYPQVGLVGWSNDTVWLDASTSKNGQPAGPGTTGFRGVPAAVWNFEIGSYRVCEKWLKDRKGRTLSAEDIAHYQKIVVAISETIRLMGKIDEVIDQHGGWPGAFAVVTNDEPPSPLD